MGEGNCFFVEIPNIVHKQYNIENVRHAQNNNRTSLKLFQKREYLKKHVQFTKKTEMSNTCYNGISEISTK